MSCAVRATGDPLTGCVPYGLRPARARRATRVERSTEGEAWRQREEAVAIDDAPTMTTSHSRPKAYDSSLMDRKREPPCMHFMLGVSCASLCYYC